MRRVRLGLLIPSSSATMEYEFNLMRPSRATVHTTGIRLHEVVVSELLNMEKKTVEVISSNTATLWSMLKRLGYKLEVKGYGTLFSTE